MAKALSYNSIKQPSNLYHSGGKMVKTNKCHIKGTDLKKKNSIFCTGLYNRLLFNGK